MITRGLTQHLNLLCLWSVQRPPEKPSATSVEGELLTRLFGPLIHARLGLVWLLLAIIAWVAMRDPAAWRRQVLFGVAGTMTLLSIIELLKVRRHGLASLKVGLDLGGMVAAQILIMLATGGLESPLLPAMIPLCGVIGFVAEARVAVAIVGGLQIPAVWVFAWLQYSGHIGHLLPDAWAHPSRGHALNGSGILMSALAMTLVFTAGSLVSRRGRTVARKLLRQVLSARDAELHEHRLRADEMTRLNAEIAHELKNPLATVKGLSALLARDLSGEAGERMGVLRREVERMQASLDSFLNFTRPLLPLHLAPVELRKLAQEVVQLHEGMASELGVRLRLEASPIGRAQCDARKLRQVLINVVQNALEVAPRTSEVSVRVVETDGQVEVQVDDAGPGVDEGLRDRIFEAGVTNKPRGSGLGLAIARGLVEQHGGRLSLRPHPTRASGTRALFSIPVHAHNPEERTQ